MKLWVVVLVGLFVASIDASPAKADVNIEASGPTISITGGEAGVIGTQGRKISPVVKGHPHIEKRVRHPVPPAPSTLDIVLKAIRTFLEPIIKFITKLLSPSLLTTINNIIVSFLEIEIIKNVIAFLKPVIGGILEFFIEALLPLGKILTTFLGNPLGIISDVISTFVGFVVNFVKSLVELFGNPISILEKRVEKLIGGPLKLAGSPVLKYLTEFFTNPLHALKTLLKTIETTFGPVLLPVILLVSGGPIVVMLIFSLFKTVITNLGHFIGAFLFLPITIVTGGFSFLTFVFHNLFTIVGWVLSTFFGGFTFVIYLFGALFRIVGSAFSTLFGLTNVAVTIFRVPFNALSFLLNILTSIFSTVFKILISLFGDALSGITNVAGVLGSIGSFITPLILSVILKLVRSFISIPGYMFSFLLTLIESAFNILSVSVFDVNNLLAGLISSLGKLFWNLLVPVTFFVNIGEVIVSVIFNTIKFVLSAPINLLRSPAAFLSSFTGLFTNITSLVLKFVSTLLGSIYSVIKYLFSFPKTIISSVFKGVLAILSYVLKTILALLGKLGGAVVSTVTSPFKRLSEVASALTGEIGQLAISSTSLNDFFYKLPASVLKYRDLAVTTVSILVANFLSLLRGAVTKFFSVLLTGIWPLLKKIASFILTPFKGVISSIVTLLSKFSIIEIFSPLGDPFKVFRSGFTSALNEIVQVLSKLLKFSILSELQNVWSSESEHLLKSFRKLFGEIRKMAFHQSHDLIGVLKIFQGSLLKILQLTYAIITDSFSPVLVSFGKLSSTVLEFLHVIVKFLVSKLPVLGNALI